MRATVCTQARGVLYAPHYTEGCAVYEINTPKRMAMFFAQIGHESGSLAYTSEIWGPTDAQARYEGRVDLGNIKPGDGSRYRGHGHIQTTGRANHRATTNRMRTRFADVPDFEAMPLKLTEPRWAALSACAFWDWKNLNRFADADQFKGCTKAINGGFNGLPDREKRWAVATLAFKN